MRVPPLLWLLFHVLRGLVWVAIRIFYRKVTVLGRSHLRDISGPLIVVVNHPSTLTDVLVPCPHIPRVVYFLANYGLFKNPISNKILRTLYCIPVKRREDVAEGEARNNDDAFEQSIQHLLHGGALFVAAEGVSWMDRFVRPLKSGAARIALGALERGSIEEVRILPIGLSYSAGRSQEFRSEVVMHIGAPIPATPWLDAWRKDQIPAADALMQAVHNQLVAQTIHTEDHEGDQFTAQLETLLRHTEPLPARATYERTRQVVDKYLHHTPLRTATTQYNALLEAQQVDDRGIAALGASKWRHRLEAAGLVLFAPLAALGALLWAVPCWLPGAMSRWLKLYPGYGSTVKFLVGFFFSFPLAMWLLWRGVRDTIGTEWYWPVVAALAAWGLAVEIYLDHFIRWRSRQAALRLSLPVQVGLLQSRQVAMALLGR
jgi:glycerol-3-phosphate O-acyltransferase / dihydroxyacetone phosphate acyltransferase